MKIVVFAYDEYAWLTPTFMHFYEKNWRNNAYQTDFVNTGGLAWADHALNYINTLGDEPFLLILNDYIIEKPVDIAAVKRAESLCVGDIGCVRLGCTHDQLREHLVDVGIVGYKEYPLDKPYAVSLQISIWQKKFFLEFLREGENIWQTETEGSKRIHTSKKKIIWTDESIISYSSQGYMQKGKIVKSVKQWVEENW